MPPTWQNKSTSSTVKKLLDEMRRRGIDARSTADRAGISFDTIKQWRRGKQSPQIILFEYFVEAAGYELQLVRKAHDSTDN